MRRPFVFKAFDDKRRSRPESELISNVEDCTETKLLEITRKTCGVCMLPLFHFDEETITLCIVSLMTFVHLNANMAAVFIVEIIQSVARQVKNWL